MAKAQCHWPNKGNNSSAFFIAGNTPVTVLSYHSNKNVVFYKFKCTFIFKLEMKRILYSLFMGREHLCLWFRISQPISIKSVLITIIQDNTQL